eukprot:13622551-Alexandrium_andersonii.AAC.1
MLTPGLKDQFPGRITVLLFGVPAVLRQGGLCSKVRASGTNAEAIPGPAQLTLRTPEALLRSPKGGLRIEA